MNSPAIHHQIMSEAPNSTVAPPLDRGYLPPDPPPVPYNAAVVIRSQPKEGQS